jgi:hypothetical protein
MIIFTKSDITIYRVKIFKIYSKKNRKKNDFHFLKLFFLNENWTFIFVHFGI